MAKIASNNITNEYLPSLGTAEVFGSHRTRLVYLGDIFFGTELAGAFHFGIYLKLLFRVYARYFCHSATLGEFLKFDLSILRTGDATIALRLGDKRHG